MNVGEKVKCINDSKFPGIDYSMFPNWLKKGSIYTIRSVEDSQGEDLRILLEEVVNPDIYFPMIIGDAEPGFSHKRFSKYEEEVISDELILELAKFQENGKDE